MSPLLPRYCSTDASAAEWGQATSFLCQKDSDDNEQQHCWDQFQEETYSPPVIQEVRPAHHHTPLPNQSIMQVTYAGNLLCRYHKQEFTA